MVSVIVLVVIVVMLTGTAPLSDSLRGRRALCQTHTEIYGTVRDDELLLSRTAAHGAYTICPMLQDIGHTVRLLSTCPRPLRS